MRRAGVWVVLGVILLGGLARLCQACTIVMVSRNGLHLAGNNEDWHDVNTWIWFYPAASGEYGRVCWGVESGFGVAQGGMNDQGLFLDANALADTGWVEDRSKPTFHGAVVDYILAHCATVDEALKFFEENNVSSLARGKVPIADAAGNSAVVEWGKGKVQLLRRQGDYQISTNFVQSNFAKLEDYPCTRYKTLTQMLSGDWTPSVDLIRAALAVTHVELINPTTYSTICDLSKRRVYLYNFHNFEDPYVFDLADQLAKGRHQYQIASLFKFPSMALLVYKQQATRKSGFEVFYPMIDRQGLDYFVNRYYEIRGQLRQAHPIDISEVEMSRLGQKLLGEGRMEAGIRVLEINVAEDPNSWRARAELADACERAGNQEKAIAAFEEALRLGPENPELARRLEFLKSQKKGK